MRTLIVSVVMVFVSVGACARLLAQENPDRLARAQRDLIAWFECIECTDFELERVVKHGSLVEGALTSTLKDGPSPARRAQIEEQLRENHRSSPSQRISEDRYVELFSESIAVGYRARAAIALGRLRTPSALAALRAAVDNTDQPEAVREAARQALGP